MKDNNSGGKDNIGSQQQRRSTREVSIIELSGDERYHLTDNYRDKEQQPSIWLLSGIVPDTSRIGFHIEAGIYDILVEPAWTTQRGGLRMLLPFPFGFLCAICYSRVRSKIERTSG
jgi:hypothetical protein